jgi:long-subunit acyl-CoA synthetase (AMP-forming)
LIDGQEIGNVSVALDMKTDEIHVQGASVMLGYYHNSIATEEVLKQTFVENAQYQLIPEPYSIFSTGDLGQYDWNTYPGEPQPRIVMKERLGDDFKLSQGEKISGKTLADLEQEIRRIKGVKEVIVCGANKPYLVALIFPESSPNPEILELEARLYQALPTIGEGLKKVKRFTVMTEGEDLLVNLKPKRKEIIKRFAEIIAKL